LNKTRSSQDDVIVIGGGPSGTATAISCAQAGLKTVLITKEDAGSASPQGKAALQPLESVHPGIKTLLNLLKSPEAISKSSKSTYDGIQVGVRHYPLSLDPRETWTGNHILRTRFDGCLLNSAQEQGVKILSNQVVRDIIENNDRVVGIKTNSGASHRSTFLIDCTGRARLVGKRLKFKEQFLSPPLVSWTGIVEGISENTYSKLKTSFIPTSNGWTWLAPEPPNRCSWTRLSRAGIGRPEPPIELKKYSPHGRLRVANVRWRIFRPLIKNGVLLAGDAAGILDPAAGQGILIAIWSGIMAARAVISSLIDPLSENWHMAYYDQWYVEQFERRAEQLKKYYQDHRIHL
jgi:flavin-dependent dehydrogenase